MSCFMSSKERQGARRRVGSARSGPEYKQDNATTAALR